MGMEDRTGHAEPTTDPGGVPASPAPGWVAPLFTALAAATVPWVAYLSVTLPQHAQVREYRLSWVGYDVVLIAALVATAVLAYRGNRQVESASVVTATLLVVDAWFDLTTTPAGRDLVVSILAAVTVEFPLAGLCLWLARHADRVVAMRVRRLALRERRLAIRAATAEARAAQARAAAARLAAGAQAAGDVEAAPGAGGVGIPMESGDVGIQPDGGEDGAPLGRPRRRAGWVILRFDRRDRRDRA